MAGNIMQRETPGEMIREYRLAAGLRQQDLYEKFGVNRVTWWSYEKKGAPRWMRYALAGYALMHCDMIPPHLRVHVSKLNEAERVEQTALSNGG